MMLPLSTDSSDTHIRAGIYSPEFIAPVRVCVRSVRVPSVAISTDMDTKYLNTNNTAIQNS